MTVKPNGVDHVALNVADVDAAITFYTEVMGLTQNFDRPDFGFPGAWFDAGAQQVHVIEAAAPPNLGQHFALLFDDIYVVVEHLRSLGLQVTDPVINGAKRHQAFVSDPWGNGIELHQLPH
jgi:catechol 2,3-dioxygenase-like lactoylglutathione lyase family enzyme